MNGIGGISQKGFTFSKEKAAIGKTSFANSAFNIQTENIGAVQSDVNGLLLSNPTLATSGTTQQLSPPLVLQGNAWGTTSSISQDVRFRMDVVPLGGGTPAGNFRLQYSVNNSSYTSAFEFSSVQGITINGTVSCNGSLTANNGIQTGGVFNGNFYLNNSQSATNISSATQLYLAGSTSTGVRLFLGGGTTNYTIGTSAAFGSTIFPNNSVTEAASGTHPIIANVAIKPIVITNAGGATTDAASLYIDGPASGITPTGGLYSILVASGTSKLNGNLYCNGNFTNTGLVPASSYAELKAGDVSYSPLIFNSGTLRTTAAAGAIDFNNSHYVTSGKRLRIGIAGSLTESLNTVGSPNSTTETDLHSYTTLADTLFVNGDSIELYYAGNFKGNTGGSQELKIYFGGFAFFSSGSMSLTTGSTSHFVINCNLIRVSATKVRCITSIQLANTAALVTATRSVQYIEATSTLSSANIIKITSTAAVAYAADDIEIYMSKLKFFPASNP